MARSLNQVTDLETHFSNRKKHQKKKPATGFSSLCSRCGSSGNGSNNLQPPTKKNLHSQLLSYFKQKRCFYFTKIRKETAKHMWIMI